MNVLLIEDDEDVAAFMGPVFNPEHSGRLLPEQERRFGSGVIQNQYDLKLLDLHFPNIGGFDILPVLRNRSPRSVIAILSGFTNLVQEEDLEQADTVLAKPVDLTVMNTHIQNVRLLRGQHKTRFKPDATQTRL